MKLLSYLLILPLLFQTNCNTENPSKDNNNEEESVTLTSWLAQKPDERAAISGLTFAKLPLSADEAAQAITAIHQDYQDQLAAQYEKQWEDRLLKIDELEMPFFYQTFGETPEEGRSLFISMHGGGGTTAEVNDQQYENQKRLYDKTMNELEGIYLAPRAPTNTWNLWHQDHIDNFFNLIIQLATIKEDVNLNKIYIMGYSAGGDGVFQLATRMADRWAGAAMMAGHPNETTPMNLRNIAFAFHMGALDSAYDRNLKALEWSNLLNALQGETPDGYIHQVQIHEGLGHWMELKDAVALPWLKNYKRNPIPTTVAWKQDDRHHSSFYWLGVKDKLIESGGVVKAEYDNQTNTINIIENYSSELKIYVNDKMLNIDEPITIQYQGNTIGERVFDRTVLNIFETIAPKGDPNLAFPVVITVINNDSLGE